MAKKLVSSGADTDLMGISPPKELIIDYIYDNWDLTFNANMPDKDTVKWRVWWTGTAGLHIASTNIGEQIRARSLGLMPGLVVYYGAVILDLFDMSLNGVYPPALGAASAFIKQLIETNADGLKTSGINQMQISRANDQREQDPTSTVFHYAIEIEYLIAKTAVSV